MIGAHGKAEAQRAVDRGRALGLENCAVYLPGQEVRCPGPAGEAVCGGLLFLRGQSSPVLVRAFAERRTEDRRTTLRPTDRRRGDTHRCPIRSHHRCEVESQPDMQVTGAA